MLTEITDDQAITLATKWFFVARDAQRAPRGNWRIWLLLGGRGAGKTRAGAEWIAEGVAQGAMQRIGLIGATFYDARAVMIEGASGLKTIDDTLTFEPSLRRITWPNGAVGTVLSADEPDGIRGHQFDAVWCDEFAKWPAPQAALDMALMALRIGNDPRMLITTTPRNIEPVLNLMTSPDVAVSVSRTKDNAENLAPGFLETMERRYAGSRLGRQELDAEMIEDNDAALWRRDWIDECRVRASESGESMLPAMDRIVVAVDPPVSVTGDECGIVVVGRAGEHGYVLADRSAGGLTPLQWAARVSDAYNEYAADRVIAEANQGGELVRAVLTQNAPNLPVTLVHATRDKRTRATPAAALYEQRRIHHVGYFPDLEDQLCTWDQTQSSPDRLDALVWALHHLFPPVPPTKPKVRRL